MAVSAHPGESTANRGAQGSTTPEAVVSRIAKRAAVVFLRVEASAEQAAAPAEQAAAPAEQAEPSAEQAAALAEQAAALAEQAAASAEQAAASAELSAARAASAVQAESVV